MRHVNEISLRAIVEEIAREIVCVFVRVARWVRTWPLRHLNSLSDLLDLLDLRRFRGLDGLSDAGRLGTVEASAGSGEPRSFQQFAAPSLLGGSGMAPALSMLDDTSHAMLPLPPSIAVYPMLQAALPPIPSPAPIPPVEPAPGPAEISPDAPTVPLSIFAVFSTAGDGVVWMLTSRGERALRSFGCAPLHGGRLELIELIELKRLIAPVPMKIESQERDAC